MRNTKTQRPNRIEQEQPKFSWKDVSDRAVDFQIRPVIKDDTRLMRAIRKALESVSPAISCFCVPLGQESTLVLFHNDPALFEDRATLEKLGKKLLGLEKATSGEVSDRSIRRVADALVSYGLNKGEQDIQHVVVIDGVQCVPRIDAGTKKPPVAAVETTTECEFIGDGVSVHDRTISIYVGGANRTLNVRRSAGESDEDVTALLSALLKRARLKLRVDRTTNGLDIRSADLRHALAACSNEDWFKDLNLPASRQAKLPV